MRGGQIELWRNGKSTKVWPVDASAWREEGWGEDPETIWSLPEAVMPSAEIEVPPTEPVVPLVETEQTPPTEVAGTAEPLSQESSPAASGRAKKATT